MIKSALEMCTKRLPKIGRYGRYKIQRCIVHINKKQNDNSSDLEVLDNLNYGIDELGAFKPWTKILSIRQITKVLGFIYKSHFKFTARGIQLLSWSSERTSRCHRRCWERVFNDAAMRMIKSWWALEVCTKRLPKIGRYWQHKFSAAVFTVQMNKKQTIPQIWKYWITSTMSWHGKATCNVENPSVCFLLATHTTSFNTKG